MKLSEAMPIFYDIDNKDIPIVKKGEAIRAVLDMETKNSLTRRTVLNVCEWLWNQVFEVAEAADEDRV